MLTRDEAERLAAETAKALFFARDGYLCDGNHLPDRSYTEVLAVVSETVARYIGDVFAPGDRVRIKAMGVETWVYSVARDRAGDYVLVEWCDHGAIRSRRCHPSELERSCNPFAERA